ncbi:PAS domain S-box protein [Campylobacter showae]|uniref:PAS domain S-box protein n=1 Tax=Campylobacter showae TaxID=204 RepID=UPI001F138A19|nr:PAS domain S-box protein [Campylobacter showae]
MASSSASKFPLARAVLGRIYVVLFATAIFLICAASFGLNLKFEGVKEDIYVANSNFKTFIKERAVNIDNELKLIERYIEAPDFDSKAIFDFAVKNNNEYMAFFIVNERGEIEFVSDEKLRDTYSAFFLSKPWENEPEDKILRSEFMFDKSDVPTRLAAKKMKNGKILATLIRFTAIYEEFARGYERIGVNSFAIDKSGRIVFHQDPELVLERKNIFDLYDVSADYLNSDEVKFANLGSLNSEIYYIQSIPRIDLAVVSSYPVDKFLKENLLFLLICAVFLVAGAFFTIYYVKFVKNSVIKPILSIRNILAKAGRGEEIKAYANFGSIKEFEQILDEIVKFHDDFVQKKMNFEDYSRKFGFLFEKGPFVMLLIDAKSGKIIEASTKACEFYGLNDVEIKNKNLAELNASNLTDMTIRQDGEAQIYETTHFVASGEVRQVRIRKQNYELPGGEKIGFCVIKDVTKSNALKKNAQKQSEIDANSPMFSVVWKDRFIGEISSVSDNIESALGYKKSEIFSNEFEFKNIIHPDDLYRLTNEFNIKFSLFNAVLLKKENEFLQTCRLIRKNLEVINCSVFIKFISKDGRTVDEVIGYFIESKLVANLTAKTGMEIARLNDDKEGAYKNTILSLFVNAQEAVAVVGLDGVFLDANEAFCRISGYSKEEAIGKPSNLLRSGVHDDKFYENMWKILLKNGFYSGKIYNKRKNGEIYLEQLSIATVYSGSKPSYFVAAFHELPWREPRIKQNESKAKEQE